MKTLITTLLFLITPCFILAQKVSIKDKDDHVLVEFNDEDTSG